MFRSFSAFSQIVFAVALLWPGVALADLRFAVLEFDNAATDPSYDALGRGLQSMLTTDLSRMGHVTIVERARLHEIIAELELADSGRVDEKTAARLGKIAGATHLLDGSFTVLDDTMRLDARLLEVQSGRVVLAHDLAGPREDFWDLQKQLVDKLVQSLSITLTSRERASIRAPHTADFEAFREFSSGLALFDDGRYDESLRALERALKVDGGFALAEATLDDYRALVEQLRGRADAIDLANAREVEQRTLGEAREGHRVIAELTELAAVAGSRGQRKRLAALHALACIHSGRHYRLDEVEDAFSLRRAHDQYVQRYMAESLELFPKVPVVPRCATFMRKAPRPDHFEEDFSALVDLLWEGAWDVPRQSWPQTRQRHLGRWLDSPTILRTEFEPLQLDQQEELELMLRAEAWRRTLGQTLDPKAQVGWQWEIQMARRMRSAGRIDEATARLEALASQIDDASDLRQLSSLVEENAAYKELAALARDEAARELFRLALANGSDRSFVRSRLEALRSDPSSPEALRSLNGLREIDSSGSFRVASVLLSDHPVWAVLVQPDLVTGPRTDPRRADELRYHVATVRSRPPETLLVVDGVPRSAYRFGVTLDPRVPDDFVARTAVGSKPARPTLDLLIGMRDIAAPDARDPQTGARGRLRPLVAHAVRLHPDRDEVELVRRASVSEGTRAIEGFEETVVQTARAPTRDAKKVSVEVDGASVVVRIDGRTVRLSAPDLEPGYYGLSIRGVGFLRVSDVVVESAR